MFIPRISPPGMSIFPVNPRRMATALTVCKELGFCSMPSPHSSTAGLFNVYVFAAFIISDGRCPGDCLGPSWSKRFNMSFEFIKTRSPLLHKLCIVDVFFDNNMYHRKGKSSVCSRSYRQPLFTILRHYKYMVFQTIKSTALERR